MANIEHTMDRGHRAKQFAPFSALKGYEDALKNKETQKQSDAMKDNSGLIPVPVIASFSSNGKMIPLYFSVEGIKIKIDRIIWAQEGLSMGSHYRCRICTGEIAEEIDLLYYKNSNVWALKK